MVMTRDDADLVSDDRLVQQALAGEELAFRQLYDRYAALLASRLRRILFFQDDVQDVLQMTFLEVHRTLARFRPESSFAAWLHGISFNVIGRYIRGQRRQRRLRLAREEVAHVNAAEAGETLEDGAMRRQLFTELQRALDELPTKLRIPFALHEFDGMGLREIGELVGATPQAVWQRIESAKKIVLKQMQKRLRLDPRGQGGLPWANR
jgi:RNA polymerase sigma-70 factor, ECF subfamily